MGNKIETGISLDQEVIQGIDIYAGALRISRSSAINMALRDFLGLIPKGVSDKLKSIAKQ